MYRVVLNTFSFFERNDYLNNNMRYVLGKNIIMSIWYTLSLLHLELTTMVSFPTCNWDQSISGVFLENVSILFLFFVYLNVCRMHALFQTDMRALFGML